MSQNAIYASQTKTDFTTEDEPFSFIRKRTTLDYILFDKQVRKELKTYKILEEGSISITLDHLPVMVVIDFVIQKHNLVIAQPKLPPWH